MCILVSLTLSAARRSPTAMPPLHQSRILIVDDEPAMTNILAELLEDEGYAVERAYNGEQALQLLQSGLRPDLVLSDVMMPKLSGTQFLHEARRIIRDVPFLLLSAAPAPPAGWGDVPFISKPLHLDGLLAHIERLLGHATASSTAVPVRA